MIRNKKSYLINVTMKVLKLLLLVVICIIFSNNVFSYITYNANNNRIFVIGDSVCGNSSSNPCTFEDIYNADKAGNLTLVDRDGISSTDSEPVSNTYNLRPADEKVMGGTKHDLWIEVENWSGFTDATIRLIGKDEAGNDQTEDIVVTGNGIYYSSKLWTELTQTQVVSVTGSGSFDYKLVQGQWGVVWRMGNMFRIVDVLLEIGDGSTESWLVDAGKEIAFEGIVTLIHVNTYGHLRLGEIVNETKRTTKNGCYLYMFSTYGYNLIDLEDGSELELFSSTMLGNPEINIRMYGDNINIRIWNSLLISITSSAQGGIAKLDANRVTLQASDKGFLFNFVYAYDFLITDCEKGIELAHVTTPLTLRNIRMISETTSFACSWMDADVYVINSECKWTFEWVSSTGKVHRQYTFNLKVVDAEGNPIPNVSVKIWDKNGNLVVNETTDSEGKIPEQILTYGYYDQEHGNTPVMFTPHTIRIHHRDYPPREFKFIVDKPIDWTISLKDRPKSFGIIQVYGTEYLPGEEGIIYAQVLYGDGTPANNALCNVTIWNKEKLFVSNQEMKHIANSNGIYYYNFTVPENISVFLADVVCENPTAYGSAEFHVRLGGQAQVNATEIAQAVWEYSNRTLTDYNQSEILSLLEDINQTVHKNYDYLSEINQTTHETYDFLVSRWGSLTAQQLYDLEQSTKQIADYINSTRWGSYVFKDVMDKWSTYTASDLYSISEQAKIIADYINKTRWNGYLASDLYSISNQAYLIAKYINETRWDTYKASDLYSISQEIKTLSVEINQTTHQTYDYLQEKWGSLTAQDLYNLENQTNYTTTQILEKWGSYTAEILYNKIEDAYLIVDYINTTRWGSYVFADIMNKWGTYTASDLYSVSNDAKVIADYINKTRWGAYVASDLYDISLEAKSIADYINSTRWNGLTANDLYQISQEIRNLVTEINETTYKTYENVSIILTKINDEIIPRLDRINQTVQKNYDFLIEINETTSAIYDYLVAKWGSLTAQQLYDLESQTKAIADYINETRWGTYIFADVMNKWGSYSAEILFTVSNQTKIIADYINTTRWGSLTAQHLYEISEKAYNISKYINETRWENRTAEELFNISEQIKTLAEEIDQTTKNYNAYFTTWNATLYSPVFVDFDVSELVYPGKIWKSTLVFTHLNGTPIDADYITIKIFDPAQDIAYETNMTRIAKGTYLAMWAIPSNLALGLYTSTAEIYLNKTLVAKRYKVFRVAQIGPADLILEVRKKYVSRSDYLPVEITIKNMGGIGTDFKLTYWIEVNGRKYSEATETLFVEGGGELTVVRDIFIPPNVPLGPAIVKAKLYYDPSQPEPEAWQTIEITPAPIGGRGYPLMVVKPKYVLTLDIKPKVFNITILDEKGNIILKKEMRTGEQILLESGRYKIIIEAPRYEKREFDIFISRDTTLVVRLERRGREIPWLLYVIGIIITILIIYKWKERWKVQK
mgnify:CR=1 FL=1